VTGLRGLLLLRSGWSGWEDWLAGAVVLLLCVVALRRWAQYVLTSRRVVVKNGYTGRDIQAMALDDIIDITVQQGPVAQFFDIGTVIVRSSRGDQVVVLHGVRHPEILKARIEALKPTLGTG
jgi:uncharacterized membrane protein YdbT with pleckstrin-like domain